jgi:hypothetical protein
MKLSVMMNSPRTMDVRGVGDWVVRQVVVEEAEHEMTLIASGGELREVLERLQGMPGVPTFNPGDDEVVALAKLDPNFPRKLDID